ncbi:hypothetical protein XELAEV_18011249mg [Xenopus laevis]|uniref:Uncharacterized protein n=1 Tax=Xenopus laevis TaxID=8355 RepID=A0A974HX55_XENLA|nr:hypothetical protein XELAEV_18011249mg [Xenopus laevis]
MRHPTQGTPVKLKHYATCDTSSVIYLLKCPCGTATDTTVSRHFNSAYHNQSQLRWAVVAVVTPSQRGGDTNKKLLQREAYWIKRLDTLQPKGMNDSWSVKCFL